jgi:hypothetical protein
MTDLAIALALSAGVLITLVSTSHDIALGFDEAFTVRRELVLAQWFTALAQPPKGLARAKLFERPVLDEFWRFSREEPDGHPPFYALIGLAGWFPTRHWLEPQTAFRFGPILLTATTCALLYLHLARRYGRLAGLVAPVLMLMMPRVFTHAHYAHYDMPVTCLWLLTQIAFIKAIDSKPWSVVFGLCLGLACATKFTGWFALAPALVWTALFEWVPNLWRWLGISRRGGEDVRTKVPADSWRATQCLLVGVILAAVTLYAIQPPWWTDPLRGVRRFLVSNLTRDRSVSVSSLYLGNLYRFALPWHNTIVLTAITTPVITLGLGSIGLVRTVKGAFADPFLAIWPLSFATLMVVRALPNAPGHDVERLLLPGLASLAVLAGIGVGWLVQKSDKWLTRSFGCLLLVGAAAESAVGFLDYYPYNLSYYSMAIGGLPGAVRLGFEPTYYWDTLGPEFCRNACSRFGLKQEPLEVRFPFNHLSALYLREWGDLPSDMRIEGLEETRKPVYILQRNLGVYADYDHILEREARPIYAISRKGVVLLGVYSSEDSERAYAKSQLRNPSLGRAPGGRF